METRTRLIAKALCWQLIGLISMAIIGYAFTGSLTAGGTLALVSMGTGFVIYLVHETLWARVTWGRRPPAG